MSILRSLSMLSNLNCISIPNILVLNRHYARVKEVTLYLVKSDGAKFKLTGEVDACTILDLVHDNIDMPAFGVCGGGPACTTCHVIFHPEDFKKLPKPDDDLELELLKHTYEVCSTSRLGCQVKLKEFMDGIEIRLPTKTRDYRNCES